MRFAETALAARNFGMEQHKRLFGKPDRRMPVLRFGLIQNQWRLLKSQKQP